MNFKPLAPLLISLGLSATAGAAVLPVYLPTTNVNVVPLVMPGITLEIIPLTMPGAPSHADIELPAPLSAPLPLRLPTPNAIPVNVAVAVAIRPLPVVEAVAAVPADEHTSARALNDLRDAIAGRPSIRVAHAEAVFDGRRESVSPTLPAGRL
ncbi:MAG: hypothetical protein HY923_07090 [Elusimicrobia bacterium]|nr:hypothetical protein [Elusimicrobiota bacterium]